MTTKASSVHCFENQNIQIKDLDFNETNSNPSQSQLRRNQSDDIWSSKPWVWRVNHDKNLQQKRF